MLVNLIPRSFSSALSTPPSRLIAKRSATSQTDPQSQQGYSVHGVQSSVSVATKSGLTLAVSVMFAALTSACTPTPPDYRAQVTAPTYEGGDPDNGALLYEEHCEQCHKLTAGSNKKGPQLLGVYMAPSADLEDYNYSEVMDNANWTWDAATLDNYIADAEAALPDTRMLSDPMPNAQHRQDIIAYLSTLGREAPPQPEQPNTN